MKLIIKHFGDNEKLINLATNIVAARLMEDINYQGRASIMLSGGSTPKPLYLALANINMPWSKVQIGMVDERWVDENNSGSNAKFIRKTLLSGKARNAQFFPMKTRHKSALSAQKYLEKTYQKITRPYSVIILGMGVDGHTASWFSGAEGIDKALDNNNENLVQPIMAKQSKITGNYLERMSLTINAISQCKCAILLLSGAEKIKVFNQALNDQNSNLPIRAAINVLADKLTVLSSD